MNTLDTIQFDSTQFINRKAELGKVESVLSTVNQIIQSPHLDTPPPPSRVVVFTGERGMGKTWLLHQIAHVSCQKSILPVECCYLNLSDYQNTDPLVAVRIILNQIAATYLGTPPQMELGAGELSQNVIKNIGQSLSNKILLLLVDHVYEAHWELLGTLETFVLAPLIVRPNVVLVMAGRGKPFPWTTHDLVVIPEEVSAFSLEDTQKQLQENQTEAANIQSITRGVPLANFYLRKGTHVEDLLGYINDMLQIVPENECSMSRDSLVALSVLQAFDETRLKAMLAIYQNEPQWEEATYGRLRQIKEILIRSGFATWMPEARGNVLRKTTRKILEKYLKLKEPDKWQRMHERAIEIYTDYLRKYTNGADRWNQEIEYHQCQLKERK